MNDTVFREYDSTRRLLCVELDALIVYATSARKHKNQPDMLFADIGVMDDRMNAIEEHAKRLAELRPLVVARTEAQMMEKKQRSA